MGKIRNHIECIRINGSVTLESSTRSKWVLNIEYGDVKDIDTTDTISTAKYYYTIPDNEFTIISTTDCFDIIEEIEGLKKELICDLNHATKITYMDTNKFLKEKGRSLQSEFPYKRFDILKKEISYTIKNVYSNGTWVNRIKSDRTLTIYRYGKIYQVNNDKIEI